MLVKKICLTAKPRLSRGRTGEHFHFTDIGDISSKGKELLGVIVLV
jgi:hypothetical protein